MLGEVTSSSSITLAAVQYGDSLSASGSSNFTHNQTFRTIFLGSEEFSSRNFTKLEMVFLNRVWLTKDVSNKLAWLNV